VIFVQDQALFQFVPVFEPAPDGVVYQLAAGAENANNGKRTIKRDGFASF
jgi:hypothetical protein